MQGIAENTEIAKFIRVSLVLSLRMFAWCIEGFQEISGPACWRVRYVVLLFRRFDVRIHHAVSDGRLVYGHGPWTLGLESPFLAHIHQVDRGWRTQVSSVHIGFRLPRVCRPAQRNSAALPKICAAIGGFVM